IYTYHTVSLGWGDIGYNAVVDRFGNSYEGRRGREGPGFDGPGGREILSEDVVAGHASHHNHGSTGIAMLGTFCSTSETWCTSGTPSSAMVQRLRELLVWECRRHQINPKASSDFLRADDVWRRDMRNLSGHRDVQGTTCPGGNVYALLPSLRDYVAGQLANSQAPTVTITSFPAEGTVSDSKADYVWKGAGGSSPLQFSYYLEGWSKSSGGISYLKGYAADRSPAWSCWSTGPEAHFTGLDPGHYTFHVRARDSQGRVSAYQDNRTFLQTGTPQPLSSPDAPFGSFVPGVAKDNPC
ncbi:MAG: N-acetylmuramoyl-L-alanine amidase, partial [Anaerolineae bacterium]